MSGSSGWSWKGGDGAWSDPNQWNVGGTTATIAPPADVTVTFETGGKVTGSNSGQGIIVQGGSPVFSGDFTYGGAQLYIQGGGNLTVDGAGSSFTSSGPNTLVWIGTSGTGTLTVSDGAKMSAPAFVDLQADCGLTLESGASLTVPELLFYDSTDALSVSAARWRVWERSLMPAPELWTARRLR